MAAIMQGRIRGHRPLLQYDRAMKILHVETGRHLYGGPQQVIYLVSALEERGHDCMLVCPPDSGIDAAARAAGIKVRNLFCAGDIDLPFAYRLKQFIDEERFDLVHCHSRRGADILGGLAAGFAHVPAIVSRRVDNREPALLASLRYRRFAKIVAISEAVAAALRSQGVDAGRIVVIRSAVDTRMIDPAPDCGEFRVRFRLPPEALVIVAAGQLIERKGHRFLLRAVAGLAASHPNVRLLIFGEGELELALREQALAAGIADIVAFPGFCSDLDAFLGCADIVAHPALAEGLGVAALKAAAAGVPVVGFAAGGLTEAVVDGETGILVEPGDSDALGRALAQLAGDASLRAAMGAAGRERMQKEFAVATMAEQHVALYESVLYG